MPKQPSKFGLNLCNNMFEEWARSGNWTLYLFYILMVFEAACILLMPSMSCLAKERVLSSTMP